MGDKLHPGYPPPLGLVPDGMRVIRYNPWDGAVTWYDEFGDTIVCHYLDIIDSDAAAWPRKEPEQWRPVDRDPDLEVGVVADIREVEREYGEFTMEPYWRQVALRLRRASKRIQISMEETINLTGHRVELGLLNWIRKAQQELGCPEDKCAVCPYRLGSK
jgi:hypothetical protein